MKIYITGIMGLLGYNIAKTFKDRCDVFGVDIADVNSDIEYNRISLIDEENVVEHIKTVKPDVLIHTAALVNVDNCEDDVELAKKFNVDITKYLACICHQLGIKMIYISTDAVFDGNDSNLYTEESRTSPINVYGKTKLDGEKQVLKYEDNLVLRTNIYGKNIQKKLSFGEWIYSSLINNETLNMFTDIDFSPILVDELAEIIYKSCKSNLCGLYNACGTGCTTKYEFAIMLKEIFNIKTGFINGTTSNTMNFKAKRSKHMGMSNEKIAKALNIHIRTPKESLLKFYSIIKEENHGN